MIVQQLIKSQAINVLDKVLANLQLANKVTDNNKQIGQKTYGAEEYSKIYEQKGILNNNQAKILNVLLNQYLRHQKGQVGNQGQMAFNQTQAKAMFQSIKTSILKEGKVKDNQEGYLVRQGTNVCAQLGSEKSALIDKTNNKPIKQNQFISRNIDRIKRYATHLTDTSLPLEPSHLSQLKISHEISHKLFHFYKGIYPTNNKLVETDNFQAKEQYKCTLNYHKVLEMLADASVKLQVENKLSLLRIVKKFAFNPNFVTVQEWVKIYRAIVNNLGVKQVALQKLVKQKQQQKKNPKILVPSINSSKTKPQYRTRRIKTQTAIPESRFVSLGSINQSENTQKNYRNEAPYIISNSAIRPIQSQSKIQPKPYNPNEYRSKHKQLLTDVSQNYIKNIKKDLRSHKMVGFANRNNNDPLKITKDQSMIENSYLKKAITSKKISKITWQTLFEMKHSAMYHNIVIPQFAKDLDNQFS